MTLVKNQVRIIFMGSLLLMMAGCASEVTSMEISTTNSEEVTSTDMSTTISIAEESSEVSATLRTSTYTNPIYEYDFPDPSIVFDERTNQYFAFATHGQILSSPDFVTWTKQNYAFTTIPQWGTTNAGLWAPHVMRIGEQYVMYYSLSTWGDSNPGIGVARAPRPNGPWVDQGELFRSLDIGVNNSIDPGVFIAETGKVFMVWGSMRGNYIVELTSDGLSLKDGSATTAATTKIHVAGLDTNTDWNVGTYEGSYVQFHDGYYYLFLSSGTCCEGNTSSYHVVVARSEFATGPYVDRNGHSMKAANVGTPILERNDSFAGPGHNAIFQDMAGDTWMLYHGYMTSNPARGRVLLVDKINWGDDGWPSIHGGTPSTTPLQGPAYWQLP